MNAMRELVSHSFEDGNLPSSWHCHTMNHTYERGALRSGDVTEVWIPLPGHGWRHLCVETDVEPVKGAVVECADDIFGIGLKVKEKDYVRHQVSKFANVLAENFRKVPDKPGIRHLVFDFDRGRMTGSVDGEEFVTATDPSPQPFLGYVRISLWNDCLVHCIRILGEDPLAAPLFSIAPRRGEFILDLAVDFYDDWFPDDSAILIGERVKFSRVMYDEFFAQLKRCGVRRVAWNYHDMLHDNPPPAGDLDVGDSFTLAVAIARKHGMEIFGVVKMLETGYFAPQAKALPSACMARKPGAWGEGINKTIQQIDLVKEDDRACAFGVKDVSLFVSDDNRKYRPYHGPIQREEIVEQYPIYEHTPSGGRKTERTRRARVMRLTGLEIREKYFVVSVPSREWSFANTLVNLIHVFGEQGEERNLTYGTASNTQTPFVADGGLETGIVFDLVAGSSPTSYLAGYDAIREPFILDLHQGFLAVAREKLQHLETSHGSLGSPSCPEAREWWLAWVRGIVDAGADGVELRWRNHTSTFTWGEFGFEPPVRNEFLRRTNVDIWKMDDFDKALWRRIRGEGYTQFLREARAITNKAGKRMILHIDAGMNMEAEEGGAMNMHWDWRTWINEGLADSLLLKDVWPTTRFAQEILSLARPRGITTVISRYLFSNVWKTPMAEQTLDGLLRIVRDAGHDGFQFYDSAGLLRGIPDRQRVVMKNPAMRGVFRRYFGTNKEA